MYPNFGTYKNNQFSIGTNGKIILGVPKLKHNRVHIHIMCNLFFLTPNIIMIQEPTLKHRNITTKHRI